ncbi:uncharacterized protein METZ01_LOCUS195285, partial [marine metagenome]
MPLAEIQLWQQPAPANTHHPYLRHPRTTRSPRAAHPYRWPASY